MTAPLIAVVRPRWSLGDRVQVCTTTRAGGVSGGPYASLNLSRGVGDEPCDVDENRARVTAALALPAPPSWCHQVHGTDVVDAGSIETPVKADAMVTDRPGVVCVVQTGDCLPVVVADRRGRAVGIAHAGWRGLAGGVIESMVGALPGTAEELEAWLGPAIGAGAYEVGEEVREAFLEPDAGAAIAFVPSPAGRWLADLYTLARRRLGALGITRVGGGDRCTFTEDEHFFSYRRDGARSGRMATFAWLGDRPGT